MMTTTTETARLPLAQPAQPQEPQAQCGRWSSNLWQRGIDHKPCDRLEGHDDFCFFEAV